MECFYPKPHESKREKLTFIFFSFNFLAGVIGRRDLPPHTPHTMAYTCPHHSMHTSTTACTHLLRHAHTSHGMHTPTMACTHLPWHAEYLLRHAHTFIMAHTGILPGPSHGLPEWLSWQDGRFRARLSRELRPSLLPLMEAQGATPRGILRSRRTFFLGRVSCLTSHSQALRPRSIDLS